LAGRYVLIGVCGVVERIERATARALGATAADG
jgi:hypothetical protein